MSTPYIGEIRIFAGTFAPLGWEFCDGRLLAISENDTLFALIGTTYGGDGQSTFALPDLRGRLPVHQDAGAPLGLSGGVETVTLTASEIPTHSHAPRASSRIASQNNPQGQVLAQSAAVDAYVGSGPFIPLASDSNAAVGGNQPHSNMQPFLSLNFIISLFGIFPSQT